MSFQTILNRLTPSSNTYASDYHLLPTQNTQTPSKHEPSPCWSRVNIPRRYARVVIALGVGFLVYLFFFARQIEQDWSNYPQEAWATLDGNPPTYNQYLEYERHLPAHNLDLPYPDGKHAKYIYFASHQWGAFSLPHL